MAVTFSAAALKGSLHSSQNLRRAGLSKFHKGENMHLHLNITGVETEEWTEESANIFLPGSVE